MPSLEFRAISGKSNVFVEGLIWVQKWEEVCFKLCTFMQQGYSHKIGANRYISKPSFSNGHSFDRFKLLFLVSIIIQKRNLDVILWYYLPFITMQKRKKKLPMHLDIIWVTNKVTDTWDRNRNFKISDFICWSI